MGPPVPKPTLIDRAIAHFAPEAGVRRLQARGVYQTMAGMGAYEGTRDTRFRTRWANSRSLSGTEDHAVGSYDRHQLILECQDLYRNNEIVQGAVNRFCDYAIWLGITPEPQTSDDGWNRGAKDFWVNEYSPAMDFRQRPGVDGSKIQRLVVSSDLLHGQSFFILLENGQIQPVESERVETPDKFQRDERVIQGIRTTPAGLITGYYVCKRSGQGGGIDRAKWDFIRRENMIHCVDPWRIDQLHGLPRIAPIVAKIRDYDETDRYTLNKVKFEGMQFFKTKRDRGAGMNDVARTYTNLDSENNSTTVEKHEFGQTWRLGPNDDVGPIESRTPNSQHVAYMEHQLRAVAAALNLPYEYLMLIFTAGSFSAQRAAMLHAQHTFRQIHQMVIRTFLQRLWNWRVAKAIKTGRLPPAPVDDRGVSQWFHVDWSLPWFGWVNPKDERAANMAAWNMGSTSLKAITRTEGGDREIILREKQEDIEIAIQRARELNERYPGAGVTWQHMINTNTPGAAATAEANDEPLPEPPDSGQDSDGDNQ